MLATPKAPSNEPPPECRPPDEGGERGRGIEIPVCEVAGPADLDRRYDVAGPFIVEIGAGRDTLLIELARRHPDRRLLGLEYAHERVERLAGKIARARVGNVRLMRCEALQAIARFLAPSSVESFFIFFPDPWPKKRHEERRLVSPPAARLFATRLAPQGTLYLKTDDGAYAEQMVAVLERAPFLRNLYGRGAFAPPEGLPDHATLYERRWRRQGKTIHALAYGRTEEP